MKLLEPAYGEKGRTRAYRLPGAKQLVAEPEKSPCPECGGGKNMVGPLTDSYASIGPFVSPVTGREFYRWVYIGDHKGHRDYTTWEDYLAAD
jgi:hypothetical protein